MRKVNIAMLFLSSAVIWFGGYMQGKRVADRWYVAHPERRIPWGDAVFTPPPCTRTFHDDGGFDFKCPAFSGTATSTGFSGSFTTAYNSETHPYSTSVPFHAITSGTSTSPLNASSSPEGNLVSFNINGGEVSCGLTVSGRVLVGKGFTLESCIRFIDGYYVGKRKGAKP
jgi:hypothetical protein